MGGSRKSSMVSTSTGSGESKSFLDNWREFPKVVFAIFGNEFCERFSYYGMRTVLTLYVVNVMGISQNDAVAVFHGFIVVCYTTPLFGSILADGYIGKFHTILWVSLLYACGNVVLAAAAFFPAGASVHPWLDFLGLLIIACGTGGIKPCVSAFGGDQFKKGQEKLLEAFFSVFYFSINAGALISTFITPLLRTMSCGGSKTCYPAAFGMPAVLMVISVVVFIAGSRWYTRKPPTENVIGKTARSIGKALANRSKAKVKKSLFLDFMDHLPDDYEPGTPEYAKWEQFAKDVKALLRVCIMYLPVPVFWALYDQQGSRWVLQAVLMDGRLGSVVLLPDQMGTFNTFLILFFIPVFQGIVYPLVRRVGINPTPLRRMTAGGLLASASFVIACFLQLAVQKTTTAPPPSGYVGMAFTSLYNCSVSVTPGKGNPLTTTKFNVTYNHTQVFEKLSLSTPTNLTWNLNGKCIGAGEQKSIVTRIAKDKNYYSTAFGPKAQVGAPGYLWNTSLATLAKAETGEGQFKMGLTNLISEPAYQGSRFWFWCQCDNGNGTYDYSACEYTMCNPNSTDGFAPVYSTYQNTSDFIELKPGTWRLFFSLVPGNNTSWMQNAYLMNRTSLIFATPEQGGIYSMVISGNHQNPTKSVWVVAPSNTLNILLQVPQYVVITAGEILFSITGLEFSYSQSPASMKSVVQAVWLLTVAGGDLIDVIIALAPLGIGVAWELLLFAVLMAVVIIIFMLMSIFWYQYSYYENEEDDDGDGSIELAVTGPSAHQLVEKVKLED